MSFVIMVFDIFSNTAFCILSEEQNFTVQLIVSENENFFLLN